MTYLLDANVISEVRKARPDQNVMAWLDTVTSDELFLSALTIGEIRLGIERLRRKDPARAAELDQWLAGLRSAYGSGSRASTRRSQRNGAGSTFPTRCP